MTPLDHLPAIEAAFMALAGALDARKAADMQVRVAALERRVASVPFTAHDARILATLPAGPLAELDMRPDDFVRFVANVYALGKSRSY